MVEQARDFKPTVAVELDDITNLRLHLVSRAKKRVAVHKTEDIPVESTVETISFYWRY